MDTDGDWQDGLESADIPRMRDFLANTLAANNPTVVHNFVVGSSNYTYDTIWEAVGFRHKVTNSVDRGHAMIFGVETRQNFPDWLVKSKHIVAANGYYGNAQGTKSWIFWADGNNMWSGHQSIFGGFGAYYNSMTTKDLWFDYAQHNDFQIYQQ